MSWTKTGGEFLVNTTTVDYQDQPSVAALTGGGFVVTWTDTSATGGDTIGWAVRGQQYDSTGVKVGGEFLVNTTTTYSQYEPSVAALTGGGFVVTWRDDNFTSGVDLSDSAVRGQQYDNTGAKVGGEFLVNTTTFSRQELPSVAALTGGGFLVAWTDWSETGGDTSSRSVRGQQYDSTGAKVGGEFLVNTTTTNEQRKASVAALTSGGFVVTWEDESATGGDTSSWSVRGQQYDSTGTKVGGEFMVNTTTMDSQRYPSVAALTGGGFVVTWQDNSATGGDTSDSAVRGQQYDSTGAKVGGEFLVNTTTTNGQYNPSVAALTGGGFVVTWTDTSGTGGDTSAAAVHSQQYDSTGAKVGGEFLVNTTTTGSQSTPNVAALSGGGFVVTWADASATGDDTSFFAIRAQIYSTPPANPNLFLLSPSIDTITGTASADTIRGALADLQAGDTIDGGGGTDVIEMTAGPNFDLRIPASIVNVEQVLGTTGNDRIILNGPRGITTIDGGAGDDILHFTNMTLDLRTFTATLQNIEELYMSESGTTTLIVRASDIAVIGTFGANTASDTGVDTLATADATMTLVGKTLTNIDQLQSLSTTGTSITPPTGWIGTVTGGAGDDVISLALGNTSTIDGGAGYDTLLVTGAGIFTIPATTAVEAVLYDGSTAQSLTLPGADTRTLGTGTGNDTVTGSADSDRLFLGAGNDSFSAEAGADLAIGEGGSDTLHGGAGADTLFGGSLGSMLDGGADADTIIGYGGDDTLHGGSAGDTTANLIFGGAGNDNIQGAGILIGGTGADTVHGETGADTLFGVSGANVLNGVGGDDVIVGGSDAETIIGGLGNDTLWGGTGADRFSFLPNDGIDVIADFQVGIDKIDLTALGITAASFAALNQTQASNGVTLILTATQSISLVGVTTLVIGDVIAV